MRLGKRTVQWNKAVRSEVSARMGVISSTVLCRCCCLLIGGQWAKEFLELDQSVFGCTTEDRVTDSSKLPAADRIRHIFGSEVRSGYRMYFFQSWLSCFIQSSFFFFPLDSSPIYCCILNWFWITENKLPRHLVLSSTCSARLSDYN